MHCPHHDDGDLPIHIFTSVRGVLSPILCEAYGDPLLRFLPPLPQGGFPQKPQKAISGSIDWGMPPYIYNYSPFHISGGIYLAIVDGRRWRQCSRLTRWEHFPPLSVRGIGLEGHPYALYTLWDVVCCCMKVTQTFGSSYPELSDLCGWGGCCTHARSWRNL